MIALTCRRCGYTFPGIEAWRGATLVGPFCGQSCADAAERDSVLALNAAKRRLRTPQGGHDRFAGPDPTPNCTAVAHALYLLFEESDCTPRGLWSTAYRFWRTDPDVIASVEEVADHRIGGRISHGRLGRAYVLAWRNDYLGLRSWWVERTYRAEGGAP